jgi:hypothetical protein
MKAPQPPIMGEQDKWDSVPIALSPRRVMHWRPGGQLRQDWGGGLF